MNTPEVMVTLSVLVGVLTVASLTSFILRKRARPGPNAVLDNLNARINAWWVMIFVLAAAFLAGPLAVTLLFAFVSFAALREFITLTPTHRADHIALFMSFFVVLPMQYWLATVDWFGFFAVLIPVYGFLVLPIASVVFGDPRNFLARTAETQWGLMITVYCISHVPALLTLHIPGYAGRDALLIVFLLIVVQSSDVLQYIWGKLFGRHLVAPELSPSKTVEGLIGGVLSATVLGACLWKLTPFQWWQAAGMAFVVTMMGFLGGLVMSAIKRDRGVKDWGHLIEGHGGMLDRLDSVAFSAPIFFHLTRFFFTP
ncbi:phosphatidate cytidylyltransferase [Paludibaculum fermentans]|uniref:Phosphatidate cytidylyltransferase n=1 Tax=Paludibaculum fermentans TaxID=1473598 RepID=A0A7S7NWU3_PALFE|nr:phosphatidate cytidylyltransferase [Paludibaculum fermentans]QOY91263.1 phosphatidate cytidylyltransferase [Paludibaculum fermentans]